MKVKEAYKTMKKGGKIKLGRMLEMTVNVSEIIKVDVEPGDLYSKENLGFSWNVASFTKTQLDIQLTFEKPLYVSVGPDKDSLHVYLNASYFIDEEFLALTNETTTLFKPIPKQLSGVAE